MDKKLPIYELILTAENHGVQKISLVDQPAIMINWVAFSKQIQFAEIKEQKKLAGAFLIPDQKIYRKDESGEYYIKASAQTIQEVADKFNSEQRGRQINIMHENGSTISCAFVAENWIVSGQNDKSKTFGFDLPEGSWFGIVKIEDENFWNQAVKTEKLRGFSIEGMFGQQKVKMNKNMNYGKFKLEKEASLEDGTIIYTTAANFEVGAPVFVLDEAGNQFAIADGDYVLTGVGVITVKDGMVTDMVAEEAQPVEEAKAPEAAASVEPVAEQVKQEVAPIDMEQIMAAIQPMLDELNARVSAMEQKVNEIEAGTGQAINELKDAKSELSTQLAAVKDSMPSVSVDKPETKSVKFGTEPKVKMSPLEQIKEAEKILQALNKK